jgi:hypothetical protein
MAVQYSQRSQLRGMTNIWTYEYTECAVCSSVYPDVGLRQMSDIWTYEYTNVQSVPLSECKIYDTSKNANKKKVRQKKQT